MTNGSAADGEGDLNSVSDANGAAIDAVGVGIGALLTALSAVQPYAALVVAIISIVETLITLSQPDPVQSKLAEVEQTLNNAFQRLAGDAVAREITSRNTTLYNIFTPAYTQLQTLKGEVDANPTPAEVIDFIRPCITALDSLGGGTQPNEVWNMTFDSRVFWTDAGLYQNFCYDPPFTLSNPAGYGLQAPPVSADSTVWVYNYSLPLYMLTVSVLLSVGGALDPQFIGNYTAELRSAAALLNSVYEQIFDVGLVRLSPPDWTNTGLIHSACPNRAPGIRLLYNASQQPIGASIEYGAVEKFSGCSSMGDGYVINISSAADNQGVGIFNKFQLRVMKRAKDVYIAVNLPRVREVVNHLNSLVGDAPPLPDPSFADWSFRRDILPLAQLAPLAGGQSLRSLAGFIIGTQPFDTPYKSVAEDVSFRQLLTNVPH
jgi:hypothetical protein